MHPLFDEGGEKPGCLLEGVRPVVMFGAGRFAKAVLENSGASIRPEFCVDSNSRLWGSSVAGVPVMSPQALYDHVPRPIVVVAMMVTGGVERELIARGFNCLFAERDGHIGYLPGSHLLDDAESLYRLWHTLADDTSRRVSLAAWKARIFQSVHFEMIGSPFLHHVYTGPQYFVDEILDFGDGETWLDCGAYDGDFLVSGHAYMLGKGLRAPRVHALEADDVNLARLQRTVTEYGLLDVKLHHAMVGADDGWCSAPDFNSCRGDGFASQAVRRVRLDSLFSEEPVHFVKMDIEGAEPQALTGAAGLIAASRPKLAVSVYHETRHLIDIPLSIHEQHPGYRLYVRHHSSNTLWETICYAVPE